MPTVIDLFSGAGGLSEGFRQAGCQILAGSDLDPDAGLTFAKSHPEARFLSGSIYDLTGSDFLQASSLQRGELDILVGGPPCQGFSIGNHNRGMHDARSHLFKEYLRVVADVMPKWLVMENVTGIMTVDGGEAFGAVKESIRTLGYTVEARTLKAEQYGVPQERRRVVFLANRVGAPIVWPEKTHGPGRRPFVTIADAIGDLPPLKNGEGSEIMSYPGFARSAYQMLMRYGSDACHNHSAPKLGAINLQRMQHIPQGGSWRDIPFDLLPAGMKKAKRSDHTKRYGRLRWDGLSGTVLTKCDMHWGAFIHPDQNRTLTVREAARIQSFPDRFHFTGSRTKQFTQVGNAVPPLMAKSIAKAILAAN